MANNRAYDCCHIFPGVQPGLFAFLVLSHFNNTIHEKNEVII